jgi:hypothetical protein
MAFSQATGYRLFLTSTEAVLTLRHGREDPEGGSREGTTWEGGHSSRPSHSAFRIPNSMVLPFKRHAIGTQCEDSSARPTSKTFDGQPVKGSDFLSSVRCRQHKTH